MILAIKGHSQFWEWPSLATITQPIYSVNSLLITHSRQNKWMIMSATGMTIILIVLVVMAFFVILYMCINCYRGFTHELESKKPPSQRRIKPRNRQTSCSSSEQMQKPASLLQVLWLWHMKTYPSFEWVWISCVLRIWKMLTVTNNVLKNSPSWWTHKIRYHTTYRNELLCQLFWALR